MTHGERFRQLFVEVTKRTKGKGAAFWWDLAVRIGGWKNPRGKGGGNGYLAWCASSLSERVRMTLEEMALPPEVVEQCLLSFGKKPKRGRYRGGNASVHMIWDDARELEIVVPAPVLGAFAFVETRGASRPAWKGKPGHISAAVLDMRERKGSKQVLLQEGNLGGKDRPIWRSIVAGANARERVVGFGNLGLLIDRLMTAHEAKTPAAPSAVVAPALADADIDTAWEAEIDDEDTDSDVLPPGSLVMTTVLATGELVRCEATGCAPDADGDAGTMLRVIDDSRVLNPDQYELEEMLDEVAA